MAGLHEQARRQSVGRGADGVLRVPRICSGRVGSRDIDAGPAVLEEAADGVSKVVGCLAGVVEFERINASIDPLEVKEAREQLRLACDRSEACRTDEPGRAGAYSFDG